GGTCARKASRPNVRCPIPANRRNRPSRILATVRIPREYASRIAPFRAWVRLWLAAAMAQFPVTCLIQPADQPPDLMIEAARVAESAGIEELWLWEDCFAASGIAPAAAILGSTQRIRVGIGLLPAPLRAPSLTAMEI